MFDFQNYFIRNSYYIHDNTLKTRKPFQAEVEWTQFRYFLFKLRKICRPYLC
jgi:hypothetical protein